MKTKRLHAFSLVELVIVLMIIAILVALVMPLLNTMPEKITLVEAEKTMGAMRSCLIFYQKEMGAFPDTPGVTTTVAMEGVLGEIVDEGKAFFNYTFVKQDFEKCTIYAERNSYKLKNYQNPSRHTLLKMNIYASGRADNFEYKFMVSDVPEPGGSVFTVW